MRRDELYLGDIIESADAVARFIAGVEEGDFSANDLLRSAVLQKLIIIGECASRVSDELKKRIPEIPWNDIIAFRNIAIHAYFSVNWSTVWVTSTEEIPTLKRQIEKILDTPETGVDHDPV